MKMIKFKSRVTKKEKEKIWQFVNETDDVYRDFFITKDNSRLFIKENLNVLFECLKNGDKIAYNKKGIVLVTGFSDDFKRHYIKFLTKDENTAEDLLRVLSWNLKVDFYCKIKKSNNIVNILKRNGFKFLGSRGNEILLVRKYRGLIKEKIKC